MVLYLSYSNIVVLVKYRSNNYPGQSFTRISDLLVVAAAVVVTFSDAIFIIVIVAIGHTHDKSAS
jgi:hypothetical protein